jgi:hypothetical protein
MSGAPTLERFGLVAQLHINSTAAVHVGQRLRPGDLDDTEEAIELAPDVLEAEPWPAPRFSVH